jgi:hypothetical protein
MGLLLARQAGVLPFELYPQCFFALVIFQIVLHFCQGPLGPRTSTYAFSVLVITAFFVVVDMGNH